MDRKTLLKGFTVATLIVMLSITLYLAVPSVLASSNSTTSTFTLNGETVTVTKTAVTGGFIYVGEVVTSSYTEDFSISSTMLNGVNVTSASISIVGNGYTISEASVKTESVSGSTLSDLTTYVNQTGSYSVETNTATSGGTTSGYMTENMYAPIGKYSFTLTPENGGASDKVLVTLPNGQTIDPWLEKTYSGWHGAWWAPYELLGCIIDWNWWETFAAGALLLILGVVSVEAVGVFVTIAGAVLLVAQGYVASDHVNHSYWDVMLLYGCVLYGYETGYHTNWEWGNTLSKWWYIPVNPTGAGWHTGIWPCGY